jgi:hypothetical protein
MNWNEFWALKWQEAMVGLWFAAGVIAIWLIGWVVVYWRRKGRSDDEPQVEKGDEKP